MMIFVYFLIFVFSLFMFLGFLIGYRLMHPKRYPVLETFQEQYEKGFIPEEFLKKERTVFKVLSDFGYELSGFYFSGNSNKTIVFHHGIAWTKYGNAKYLKYFFDNGWNLVLYDQRASGESGGRYPSFGYYEKQDLKRVLEFARRKFPNTKTLGIFGESFGGALCLQYSAIEPHLDFIIAICPFTSLTGLIRHHLNSLKVPKILQYIVLPFVNLYTLALGNFSIYKVNPLLDSLLSFSPILLIHGEKDPLVPVSMLEDLYVMRENLYPTQLFIFQEGKHTPELYLENKKEIDKIIAEFLEFEKDQPISKRVFIAK